MAKKELGKFAVLAAVSGAIAAGISYFLRYKFSSNGLDEDFRDFERGDDEFDGELPYASETGRTYATSGDKKEGTAEVVKNAAKNVTKKAAEVIYDVKDAVTNAVSVTTDDAVQEIQDTAKKAVERAKDTIENAEDMSGMVEGAVIETAEAAEYAAEDSMSIAVEDDRIQIH